MKIVYQDQVSQEPAQLRIETRDQKFVFDAHFWEKCSVGPDFAQKAFVLHNAYWQTRPPVELRMLSRIYKHSATLYPNHQRRDMEGDAQRRYLHRQTKAVEEIAYLHSMTNVRQFYLEQYEALRLAEDGPGGLVNENEAELAATALWMRSFVPILSNVLYHTRTWTGTAFKEYAAFKLFSDTPLMSFRSIQQLREMIDKQLEENATDILRMAYGLSSEDLPLWLLSLTVVRRLAIAPLLDRDSPVIAFVYRFMSAKLRGAIAADRTPSALQRVDQMLAQ